MSTDNQTSTTTMNWLLASRDQVVNLAGLLSTTTEVLSKDKDIPKLFAPDISSNKALREMQDTIHNQTQATISSDVEILIGYLRTSVTQETPPSLTQEVLTLLVKGLAVIRMTVAMISHEYSENMDELQEISSIAGALIVKSLDIKEVISTGLECTLWARGGAI